MTPESGRPALEGPTTASAWFDRIPPWARIAVPVAVVAGGAAVVASLMAAGSSPPATPEALCGSAVTARLESRGHSDIDVARSLQLTTAGDAQRVSGTVTFVDDAGADHHAALRCMVRSDGGVLRVTSVRVSE